MMPLHYMRLNAENKNLFHVAKQKQRSTKLGDVHDNDPNESHKLTELPIHKFTHNPKTTNLNSQKNTFEHWPIEMFKSC